MNVFSAGIYTYGYTCGNQNHSPLHLQCVRILKIIEIEYEDNVLRKSGSELLPLGSDHKWSFRGALKK